MSNKPEKSKEYSEQALAIILKEITENKFDSKFVKKIASVGVIAFYYIGVCEETKKNVNDMLIAYENAVRLGEKYLSKEDEILKLSKKAMSDLTNGNLITQETNDQSNLDAQELTVLSNPPSHNHTLMISSSHTSPPIIHAYDSLSKSITRPSIKRAKIPPPQHIDEKLPGRYYSQRQLQKITEHLSQEKSIKVISADNHFYNKISKSLNLSKNTLKKVNSVKDINKSHREEKGVIYRLRKRKAPHKQYKNIQNISSFEKTLERLNSEDEIRLRKQEAILSSKMNTKIYKQMLQSLNLPLGSKVRKPPKPRLKFVPLYDSLNRSFEDSEIEITVKGNSYEKANTEIGDLMVIIENSLKIPKKSPKIMRNYTEIGDLAKSA